MVVLLLVVVVAIVEGHGVCAELRLREHVNDINDALASEHGFVLFELTLAFGVAMAPNGLQLRSARDAGVVVVGVVLGRSEGIERLMLELVKVGLAMKEFEKCCGSVVVVVIGIEFRLEMTRAKILDGREAGRTVLLLMLRRSEMIIAVFVVVVGRVEVTLEAGGLSVRPIVVVVVVVVVR